MSIFQQYFFQFKELLWPRVKFTKCSFRGPLWLGEVYSPCDFKIPSRTDKNIKGTLPFLKDNVLAWIGMSLKVMQKSKSMKAEGLRACLHTAFAAAFDLS